MYLVSAPQFDEAHDDAAVVVLVNNLHQDLHRTVGGVFVVGVSGGIRQPDANSLLTDAQSQKKKKKKTRMLVRSAHTPYAEVYSASTSTPALTHACATAHYQTGPRI